MMSIRRWIRAKALQLFFALNFVESSGIAIPEVRKKVRESLFAVNQLHLCCLSLLVYLRNDFIRRQKIQEKQKNRVSNRDYKTFINNRVLSLLSEDVSLQANLQKLPINWGIEVGYINQFVEAILNLEEYQTSESNDWKEDVALLSSLYEEIIFKDENFLSHLEDMNSYWAMDQEIVHFFLQEELRKLKPVHFEKKSYPIIERFGNNVEDQNYVTKQVHYVLNNNESLDTLLKNNLQNWELDRVSEMDKAIIKMCTAEIIEEPEIAINISINEFVELAKWFGSKHSHTFVNGIMAGIVKELRNTKQITK